MGTAQKPRDAYLAEAVYVVFKRKKLVLSIFLLVMAAVAAGILMSTEQYEASALLMIKRDRGELVVTPSSSGGNVNLRVNLDQDLNSEAELLRRRSLLGSVVQAVGPDVLLKGRVAAAPGGTAQGDEKWAFRAINFVQEKLGLARPAVAVPASSVSWGPARDAMPGGALDQAISALDTKLQVQPILNSNLIRVTYASEDPRLAAGVLDLLIKNYLDQYTRIRATPGVVDFFERQVKTLSTELQTAEEALREFDAQRGITAVGQQRALYLTTGNEREVALRLARSAVDELKEKAKVLRAELGRLPERVETGQEVRRNPVRDAMASKLLEFEVERNKLLQKYMDGDRRVKDVEREIELLRDRFLAAGEWEVARKAYGDNPLRNPLLIDLVQTEAQLLKEQVRVAHLEQDMKEFYARLRHLDASAFERARRERTIKMLEDAYLLYTKKYEEARISTALDQSRIVNVAVAEPVQVAPKRKAAGRSPMQLLLLGAVVGLVSGVGGAFCREYFSPSFTTDDSVSRHLGLPVIGSIADRGKKRDTTS